MNTNFKDKGVRVYGALLLAMTMAFSVFAPAATAYASTWTSAGGYEVTETRTSTDVDVTLKKTRRIAASSNTTGPVRWTLSNTVSDGPQWGQFGSMLTGRLWTYQITKNYASTQLQPGEDILGFRVYLVAHLQRINSYAFQLVPADGTLTTPPYTANWTGAPGTTQYATMEGSRYNTFKDSIFGFFLPKLAITPQNGFDTGRAQLRFHSQQVSTVAGDPVDSSKVTGFRMIPVSDTLTGTADISDNQATPAQFWLSPYTSTIPEYAPNLPTDEVLALDLDFTDVPSYKVSFEQESNTAIWGWEPGTNHLTQSYVRYETTVGKVIEASISKPDDMTIELGQNASFSSTISSTYASDDSTAPWKGTMQYKKAGDTEWTDVNDQAESDSPVTRTYSLISPDMSWDNAQFRYKYSPDDDPSVVIYGNTGILRITQPTSLYGSITVLKLLRDRIPTGDPDHDGNELDVIPEGTPLEGIDFIATRVVPDSNQSGSESATRWLGPDGLFYVAASSPAYSQTVTTDGNGIAVFGVPGDPLGEGDSDTVRLPLGVYRIVEQPSDKTTDQAKPFFISVPTINEKVIYDVDGETVIEVIDEYIYDVHCYPKNENVDITKVIVGPSGNGAGVGYGDVVTYKLTVGVPTDIGNAQVFKVVDTYDVGLKPVPIGGAVTTLGDFKATALATADLPALSLSPSLTIADTDGGTITADFIGSKAALAGYEKIEIFVSFVIQDTASLTSDINNEAKLHYTNRYGTEHTRGKDKPYVRTGGARIFKHDAVVTDLGLDGAKFVLVPKSAANPEAPFANEKAHFNNDAGGFTEGIPNNAFKRAGIPLVETSANGGVVTFKGIPYGSVVGSTYTASPTEYWLYEIEAPEGYRKPSGAPISITIDSNSYNEAIYVAQVANTKGFNMPFTGGAGTIVFAVAALALAGLAYRFDMLSKREKLRVQ